MCHETRHFGPYGLYISEVFLRNLKGTLNGSEEVENDLELPNEANEEPYDAELANENGSFRQPEMYVSVVAFVNGISGGTAKSDVLK